MAASATATYTEGKIRKISVAWTSASNGSVSQAVPVDGAIVRVVTNPGATAPSDNWDLTLVDEDGVDVLAGEGANRDTSNSEQIYPTDTPFVNGTVTVTVANAGDSKVGTVVLYIAWG